MNAFDQAEAEVDFGTPWMFREPDAPNPLTIQVTEWSLDVNLNPAYAPVDLVKGRDRDGKLWSVMCSTLVLKKHLIEGEIEKWDDDKKAFVVAETLGRAAPGDVISLKYSGEETAASGFTYPSFRISRVAGETTPTVATESVEMPATEQAAAAVAAAEATPAEAQVAAAAAANDDIPF